MFSKQISVFVENRNGRLSEIMNVIKKSGANLRALSLADTSNYGVLRFIADNSDKALASLKEAGMMASVSDVVTVRLKDEAGGLANMLAKLSEFNIGVAYAYAFISRKDGEACVVLRCSDDEKAAEILSGAGYLPAESL